LRGGEGQDRGASSGSAQLYTRIPEPSDARRVKIGRRACRAQYAKFNRAALLPRVARGSRQSPIWNPQSSGFPSFALRSRSLAADGQLPPTELRKTRREPFARIRPFRAAGAA